MQTVYLLYSAATAFWVFNDAAGRKESRWFWSIGSFIMPLLFPAYLSRTRTWGESWRCFGLWLSGYVVVFAIAGIMAKS